MKVISNSTPLIYLAKLKKLPLLREMFKEILIPEEVYKEVIVEGKKLKKPEVILLEKLVNDGYIKIQKPKPKMEVDTLHKGEIGAISLALNSKNKIILIDDKEGVEVCKILGLKPFRTTTLLLEMLKKNMIDLAEFKDLLVGLSNHGYFLRADVFEFLVKEAKKYKK